MQQDPQPSIVDTANQQAANMIAIDAANDAARREQAIQLANVKQSNSGQASPAGASSPKSVPLWIAIAFSTLGDETNNFGGDGAWELRLTRMPRRLSTNPRLNVSSPRTCQIGAVPQTAVASPHALSQE